MMQYKKFTRLSASRYLGVTIKTLAKIEEEGLLQYIDIPIGGGKKFVLHQENWLDDFLQRKRVIQGL
jgi:hypothetical protein